MNDFMPPGMTSFGGSSTSRRDVPDLIVTGVPRSGTSLAAAIIDQAPGCLCLSEPENQVELMRGAVSAEDFVAMVGEEFDTVRRSVLAGSPILDRRRADGAAVTNYFTGEQPDGKRITGYTIRAITRPGLSADFVLAVKHVALYAAVLPQLVQSGRYRVVALVRDPVALLTSWQSLDVPVSQGRLPAGERFWPELKLLGEAELELTEKQVRLCELLFGRFLRWADRIAILRYEELVADPVRLLRAAGISEIGAPSASALIEQPPARRACRDREIRLTERVRQLAAGGELPAICKLYPDYGPA